MADKAGAKALVLVQLCLEFSLQREVSTERWRSMLATWIQQHEGNLGLEAGDRQALFHHGSNGHPANSLPCLRFHCDSGTGRIYAIGEDAVALLHRVAARIHGAGEAGFWLNAPLLVAQELDIEAQATEIHYSVNDLVICRYAEQYKQWAKSSHESRGLHVQDILQRGLQRQLRVLSLDIALPCPMVLSVCHERAVPKLQSASSMKVFVRLASVVFTLPAALKGHWVAGGLINRGYGRIQAA